MSNLWEMETDRQAWHAASMGSQRVGHDLATEWQKKSGLIFAFGFWKVTCHPDRRANMEDGAGHAGKTTHMAW